MSCYCMSSTCPDCTGAKHDPAYWKDPGNYFNAPNTVAGPREALTQVEKVTAPPVYPTDTAIHLCRICGRQSTLGFDTCSACNEVIKALEVRKQAKAEELRQWQPKDAPCPTGCRYLNPSRTSPSAEVENTALHKRSGHVESSDLLVGFLYELMRDHMTVGEVEKLVRGQKNEPFLFTNGYLARYAQDLAARLRKKD